MGCGDPYLSFYDKDEEPILIYRSLYLCMKTLTCQVVVASVLEM